MLDSMSRYRDTRAVVLGGSGFIGRWVARKLSEAGAELYVAARSASAAEYLSDSYGFDGVIQEVDVADFDAVTAVLREVRPAIVFNLVGYGVDKTETNQAQAQRINAEFVEALCRVVPEVSEPGWEGQRLVHVGSALEYGTAKGDLSEDCVPQPTTWYGRTKLAGTTALRWCSEEQGIPAVTARIFTVYGPGEHPGRLLPSLVEAAHNGETLQLTAGHQLRDFTYVEDVADGLLRLGVLPAVTGGVVNLATGTLTSVREFIDISAQILQIPEHDLRFGALPTRSEEMAHDPVSVERLKSLVHWVPATSVYDGIRQTVTFALSGGD